MTLVPVPRLPRDELLQLARRRWNEILAAHADLAAAVALQERLVRVLIDLSRALDEEGLAPLALPADDLAAKLTRGVPALIGERIPPPVPVMILPLLRIANELADGGAGSAAEHIHTAIETGDIDPGSLLSASLQRDEHAIREGLMHRGLAPDLVWLIAELACSPWAHALQQGLFENLTPTSILGAAADAWAAGYCPACGSWPAVAERADGRRVLRCSFCALAWETAPARCIYCGESGGRFAAEPGAGDEGPGFLADTERERAGLELCAACGGYLKIVATDALTPFPLVAAIDLRTTALDVGAMARGFARPALSATVRSNARRNAPCRPA